MHVCAHMVVYTCRAEGPPLRGGFKEKFGRLKAAMILFLFSYKVIQIVVYKVQQKLGGKKTA